MQVRLREALALPTDAAEMTFYHLAEFAPEQLQKASHEVKTAEAEAFPAFLAGWAPWRSVIERLAPASHQAAQAALAEALGDPFEAALTARLTPDKLQDDADSRRIAGPAVMAALAQDIHMAQTRAFLGAEKMSALLASPW